MSVSSRPRGLGRGLDALLSLPNAGNNGRPRSNSPRSTNNDAARNEPGPVVCPTLFQCAIEKIVPNRGQPRKHFAAGPLKELTDSIRSHGLLEPIVVRRVGKTSDRFEIVAGERRFRASQKAGLREVPVHLRQVEDKHAFELALVENIQREDLNAIEFAVAVRSLLDEHQYTQESLAARLHKDRSTLANALRLLKLPERVQQLVISGQLSEGHGRAVLAAPDEATMIELANQVIQKKWSVRQTEAAAKALRSDGLAPSPDAKKSPGIRDLESRLARRYGTRCEVHDKKGKGEILIRYANLDELDRILEQMFP